MSDLDLIIQRLELRGHRIPASRRRVLDALFSAPAHFTVEDVLRQAPDVGRATVFRTMKLLQDLNVVCRVMMEDGNLHYQLSHHGHHHHLLCVECGSSQDLLGCDIEDQLHEVSAAHSFQLSGHWLEVYGLCQDCQPQVSEPLS